MEQPAGLLLIDKPSGITSFDCIRHLRRSAGIRKMGHAGTLDPMASGLMIILVGSATKQATNLLKLDKGYQAEVTLGAVSSTGDAEGELRPISDIKPESGAIEAALERFRGAIMQVPPAYSAIKINGQPAYKRARKGETVTIPAREVTIHRLDLVDYQYPRLEIEAEVSSGTYIRTLAEDIGAALGTGAYLSALRRTHIGKYDVSKATNLEAVSAENIHTHLIKINI